MKKETIEKINKACQHRRSLCEKEINTRSYKSPLQCWDIFAMMIHEQRDKCAISRKISEKLKGQ